MFLVQGFGNLKKPRFPVAWKDWAWLQEFGFKFPVEGSVPVIFISMVYTDDTISTKSYDRNKWSAATLIRQWPYHIGTV